MNIQFICNICTCRSVATPYLHLKWSADVSLIVCNDISSLIGNKGCYFLWLTPQFYLMVCWSEMFLLTFCYVTWCHTGSCLGWWWIKENKKSELDLEVPVIPLPWLTYKEVGGGLRLIFGGAYIQSLEVCCIAHWLGYVYLALSRNFSLLNCACVECTNLQRGLCVKFLSMLNRNSMIWAVLSGIL